MKKVLLLFLSLSLGSKFVIAQDGENDLKNFRFGLKVAPALTWYKPDASSKNFTKNGASVKLQYGLITEFRLNKVASFVTGFEVAYDGGKLSVANTNTAPNYYYISNDGNLLETRDTAGQKYTPYELYSRAYKTTYLTLPVTLKLKTNEIGMITYFGQIGLNSSVRLKSHATDDVVQGTNTMVFPYMSFPSNTPHTTLKDLDNTKDMQLLKFALNVGLGLEYNLSGSTSLEVGVHYYQGFSNVTKKDSRYLFGTDGASGYTPIKQDIKSNAIALTIGVLF